MSARPHHGRRKLNCCVNTVMKRKPTEPPLAEGHLQAEDEASPRVQHDQQRNTRVHTESWWSAYSPHEVNRDQKDRAGSFQKYYAGP